MMKRPLLYFLFFLSCAALQAQSETQTSVFQNGEGVNGQVLAISAQPDGKIVIGGNFSAVNGVARQNVARLNSDGTLDQTFADQYENGVNGPIFALAACRNGSVIVGGNFSIAGNKTRRNVALYKVDGSLDENFGSSEGGEITNGPVQALAVQPDGKIILGGNFTTVYGQPRRSLARLNSDGTLDAPLSPQNAINGDVNAVAFSSGVLAGGNFPASGKVPRSIWKSESPSTRQGP